MSGSFSRLRGLAWLALLAVAGCAGYADRHAGEPLRLSQIRTDDPVQRASLRLCLDGLAADAAGNTGSARSHYARAIQIDPNNPYAYLALARHEVEAGDGRQALEYLELVESLLPADDPLSPRVEPHLHGLRGAALQAMGKSGSFELEQAESAAPGVWGDGHLSAQELR